MVWTTNLLPGLASAAQPIFDVLALLKFGQFSHPNMG
jgi:hypothetical protein